MSRLSRLARRVRRQLLRWYEIGLCALLLALALAIAAPSSARDEAGDSVQCGNIQSSTVVIDR